MPESATERFIKMRILFALFVAATFFTQTRTASAQPQQVRVPYEVCPGTSQRELCEALALLRQQQAAAPVVVAPLSAPPAVAAAVRPPRCPSGSAGSECRCHARGRVFQEGRCLSTRVVVARVSTDTRDLAERVTRLEGTVGEIQTHQATTDRRVSENAAATNCLEIILIPNVGVDPASARRMATEERASELGRLHGPYCADFYRAAYGLPTPPTARMATAPTPPPPPPPVPANAPTPPPAADGPITVTFQ